ncbi:BREX-1 system adenine-specific DNA-methyltransferase PglX [Shewanella sp. SM73]|uniref:BREX-1 system adenine-specific DNA-methyltransferase PglX n=1 Tax=Shewanella sp. SM73 TaxID=2912806 RepID=UPI0021D82EA5|nr:BREX-1 system adenine-specific DNA-methyltransferase PglX [Shewanella sp. SM73]MCU8028533.1 BREX-1 system adenine-specific DNA-methyltransferase PglX [Shewanella sp. SM73]
MSQQDNHKMAKHFYRASTADFAKIPGSPVAYWVSRAVLEHFANKKKLEDISKPKQGATTSNNGRFLRLWHEISQNKFGINFQSLQSASESSNKWFPYNKGGDFRRWYGNQEFVINYESDGREIKEFHEELNKTSPGGRLKNQDCYFKPCISWSKISSGSFAVRYFPQGFIFDVAGSAIFFDTNKSNLYFNGVLNSTFVKYVLGALSPTLNFEAEHLCKIPVLPEEHTEEQVVALVERLVMYSKRDWDGYEVSWDFTSMPMLYSDNDRPTLGIVYQDLRANWHETTLEMHRLEEENNRILIDAYSLQDELTPEVLLSEITLTCNPHYRYGGNLTDEEREGRLKSDTIAELISYAIGCMMGRYSLDRDGLVYAHAGNEGFKALVEEGAYNTFAADGDGILPLTSEAWFEDDVAARIEAFVRTVWGAETLEENLAFIADSLCLNAIKPVKKGGETSRETLRRYLSSQFYKDHLKTYKKRPIYWLFSSGKEKAFECLVYLHRYSESTLPRMRTEYVTPLLGQIASRIERKRMEQTEASTAEAKRIGKEIDSLTKQLSELRAFDDQLKHHADMRITLDLDDGVKVNYGKFGTLLSDVKAITGDKGE